MRHRPCAMQRACKAADKLAAAAAAQTGADDAGARAPTAAAAGTEPAAAAEAQAQGGVPDTAMATVPSMMEGAAGSAELAERAAGQEAPPQVTCLAYGAIQKHTTLDASLYGIWKWASSMQR